MIGIVDSGIGGLSAYLPLREKCESDILYLADEAHLPSGEKTDAELLSYADIIESVTFDDVSALFESAFDKEKITLSVILPLESKEEL